MIARVVSPAGPHLSAHQVGAAALVALLLLASIVASARRWSPPLAVTLCIGLVLRVAVAYLAYGHTPHDAGVSFRLAGQAVLDGRDPAKVMPHFQWNFLPFSAYLFAAEIKTGLAWEAAGKMLPIACDLSSVVLLGRLCPPARRANARFLYAISPLALLVTAWHGQLEPIAVALGLAALLLASGRRPVGAGVALGLAAASKTWPALFLVGVLRGLPRPRWWGALAAAALTLLAMLASVPLFLHDGVGQVIRVVTGYRSFVGGWGWTGVLHDFHVVGLGYAGAHIDTWQKVGTATTALAVAATIVVFRRCLPAQLTASVLLAFLAVTAGFGPQYLLWPAALLCTFSSIASRVYLSLAGAYAGIFYLYVFPLGRTTASASGLLLEALSLIIVVVALACLPWSEATLVGRPALAHRRKGPHRASVGS